MPWYQHKVTKTQRASRTDGEILVIHATHRPRAWTGVNRAYEGYDTPVMEQDGEVSPLSVEEAEELLYSRRPLVGRERRYVMARVVATAKNLRRVRAEYDREMRERVAAAAAGNRTYLNPEQVLSFLSDEQRERLLDRMSRDRMEKARMLNEALEERTERVSRAYRILRDALARDAEREEMKDIIAEVRRTLEDEEAA